MSTKDKKLDLEELIGLPMHFWGALGRSSDKIVYISNKTGSPELHMLDLETMEFSQLTDGNFPKSPGGYHKWAPDDSYVLFTKDPIEGNEKYDIYSISIKDGKVTQITNNPEHRDDLGEVSHNGKWIVFSSDRAGGITQVFRMNADGSDVIQLTDHVRPVAFWDNTWISPDDEWIAYTANDTENLQNLDVWIVKIDGSERKMIYSAKEGSKDIAAGWSSDGSKLLITSDYSGNDQTGIYDIPSGDIKWFGDGKNPETAIVFTPNDECILVQRSADAEMKLILYNVETGEEIPLKVPPGSAGGRHFTMDGNRLLMGHQDSIHRMRYLLYDIVNHTYDEIIPAEYGKYRIEDFYPDDYISYKSNGVTIYAILYKPKAIPSGTKLPAIVIPHGGPTGQYFRLFDADSQVLVDRGFVLLQPNVRGSTGYGVEFRDACLNDWGGKDLDDIEAGVNYLKSLDYIDPNRIGIYGGSYGGYMTYIAITKKPELWKAASAWMGITSLKHLYDKCLETFPMLSYYLEEQMGKPDSKDTLDLWEDRSAINFVENMTANLQIIHGENDPRCPLEQAELFKNKLLELGKKEGEDFEYVILTDEGHGSVDTRHRIRMFKHLIDYFERKL